MSIDLNAVLKHKAINGWNLFALIAIPMSIVILIATLRTDLSTGAGVSSMIGFSVRWAVPIIFLVVAISALQVLFPGPVPMWLRRNRPQIGLCFAVAMAWQGMFIFIMSTFFREYYYENVYLLRDELEGSVGYIFLPAMVVTSFQFGRKHLNKMQWNLLHTSALYFLWGYPFIVYWWNLYVYENPQLIDYVFYWGGFLAFALRIAAWAKKRQQAAQRSAPESSTPLALKLLGGAIIAFGVFVAASGLHWGEAVTAFLLTPQWSANLYLWLAFWPFEPFFSLAIVGLGATLATQARQEVIHSPHQPDTLADQ